jgi:glutamate-1-semialdehyde aminotransferase
MRFTRKPALTTYRDVLEDDAAMLKCLLLAALAEGVYLLPDGRLYVSVVHRESDIDDTAATVDRAFASFVMSPALAQAEWCHERGPVASSDRSRQMTTR